MRVRYIEAMIGSAPTDKKEAYREAAQTMSAIFHKHGALRTVDAWGAQVPRGEKTDMYRAVQAQDGETIVFACMEWESKEARDKGFAAAEPEMMSANAFPPLNGALAIFGRFEPLVEHGHEEAGSYIDVMFGSVAQEQKGPYTAACASYPSYFLDNGALRSVDCWGAEVPRGEKTDIYKAVQAKDGEMPVFGWIEWDSQQAAAAGMRAAMAAMREAKVAPPPMDNDLVIFGGFEVLVRR